MFNLPDLIANYGTFVRGSQHRQRSRQYRIGRKDSGVLWPLSTPRPVGVVLAGQCLVATAPRPSVLATRHTLLRWCTHLLWCYGCSPAVAALSPCTPCKHVVTTDRELSTLGTNTHCAIYTLLCTSVYTARSGWHGHPWSKSQRRRLLLAGPVDHVASEHRAPPCR
jgi:hypothetical protein